MLYAVVGHPKRRREAWELTRTLGAVLFMDSTANPLGTAGNHRRALEYAAARTERVWIIEDDAVLTPRFKEHAATWSERFPDHLISGFLGTGHPLKWMREADRLWPLPDDHLEFRALFHGVCYSIPPAWAGLVLDGLRDKGRIDFDIGDSWYTLTHRPVIYPKRSLVDHADGPSINGDRIFSRRARLLAD